MARDETVAPEASAFPDYDDDYVQAVCFSPEGVDRTLILQALALTPTQRLERAQALARSLAPFVLAHTP